MTGILVYSEDPTICLELVTLATKLGEDCSIAAVGQGDLSEYSKKVSVSGVSKIFEVSSDTLKDLLTATVVDALEVVVSQSNPSLIIIGSTKRGRDVAARLAVRLRVGCISDALNLHSAEGNITAERLVWGGNSIAKVMSKGTSLVTVLPRAYERATGSSTPAIAKVEFQPKPSNVTIAGIKEKPKDRVDLKDAQTIVSAGRGFKKKEDLALLNDLIALLNGALGASRPLTSDLAWVPEERQVGLTGTTVKPKLYIAVGISGQIQHLTGMRDSKIVAAINTDKNAPMFQECDYGVVGDLYAIIPQLTKELKSRLDR